MYLWVYNTYGSIRRTEERHPVTVLPNDAELATVQSALDRLQAFYGVSSDKALVEKLRAAGYKTSTHVLHKWRTRKWSDADAVLVRALLIPPTPALLLPSPEPSS